MTGQKTILLVDDSENDLMLMRFAFKKAEFDTQLHVVHNGEEAIAYLKGEGAYSDRSQYPPPAVMLLDLNMPMRNGFDVLAWEAPLYDVRKAWQALQAGEARADNLLPSELVTSQLQEQARLIVF